MTFIYNFVHFVGKLKVWAIFLRSRHLSRPNDEFVWSHHTILSPRRAGRKRPLLEPLLRLVDTYRYFRIFDKITWIKSLLRIRSSFLASSSTGVLRSLSISSFSFFTVYNGLPVRSSSWTFPRPEKNSPHYFSTYITSIHISPCTSVN